MQKNTSAIPGIIASTASRLKRSGADLVADIAQAVEEQSAEEAARHLSKCGLLQRSCAPYAQSFAWPHVCPAVAFASGAREAVQLAESQGIGQLEKDWCARHVGVRAVAPVRVKTKKNRACIVGGCVCQGWPAKLYNAVRRVVKVADKEHLRSGLVVLCLDALQDAKDTDAGASSLFWRRWLHVSYLCLSPWRCTIIELQEVKKTIPNEAVERNPPVTTILAPLLLEGAPRVHAMQVFINMLDPDSLYDITLFGLSNAEVPVPDFKGQVRVMQSVPEVRTRVWQGMALEMRRRARDRQVHVRPHPVRQAPVEPGMLEGRGALEEAEDGLSEEEEEGLDDDVLFDNELMMAGAYGGAHDVEALPGPSSGSSSSSSSPRHAPEAEAAAEEVVEPPVVRRHIRPETIRAWHSFRFTWVPPRGPRLAGSWQCICPYHKKAVTGSSCKKTLTASSPAPESVERALLTMKAWAVAAGRYPSYAQHMRLVPSLAPHDTEDLLAAAAAALAEERQGRPVLRDDQLPD